MSLTVLSVAYPLMQVGEDAPGGSEQILTLLDRQLVQNGHRSVVIGAEDSRVAGTLIPSPAPRGPIDANMRKWAQCAHRRLIMDAIARYHVDLVHLHGLDFYAYIPPGSTPVLATLHLPLDWY